MREILNMGSRWEPPLRQIYGAFRTIEDVEGFYEDHREMFTRCSCENPNNRCDRHSFCRRKPGRRPWVVWRFDLGFDQVPENQSRVLEELGAFYPGEKQEIENSAKD